MIQIVDRNGDTKPFPYPLNKAIELMTLQTDAVKIAYEGHSYCLCKGRGTTGMFVCENFTEGENNIFSVQAKIDRWTIKKFIMNDREALRFTVEWETQKVRPMVSTMKMISGGNLSFQNREITPEVLLTIQNLRAMDPKMETVKVWVNFFIITRKRVSGNLFQVDIETGKLTSSHLIQVGPSSDELDDVFGAIAKK